MIRTIIMMVLIVSSAPAIKNQDKYMHVGVGVGIYAACVVIVKGMKQYGYTTSDGYGICLVPVVAAGVGKEVYDHYHPENHTADILDTAATIAIPVLFSVTVLTW